MEICFHGFLNIHFSEGELYVKRPLYYNLCHKSQTSKVVILKSFWSQPFRQWENDTLFKEQGQSFWILDFELTKHRMITGFLKHSLFIANRVKTESIRKIALFYMLEHSEHTKDFPIKRNNDEDVEHDGMFPSFASTGSRNWKF